jgi:hypothetical protein
MVEICLAFVDRLADDAKSIKRRLS